jgi:fluoroacetyl-CoA thioesterase
MFDLRSMLLPGINNTVQKLVDESDTATRYGRGSLGSLIATPAFVSLMIDASIATVENRLPDGFVTVGTSFEFTHDAPTCMGMTLRVKSTLVEINGENLLFEIVASDDYGEVGRGRHQRTVVNREHLFKKAEQRISNI